MDNQNGEATEERVQTIVERVVRDRLQSDHIVRVDAVRGSDFDGNDIIRVTIVVNAPASSFESRRLSSLCRHMRDALADEADEHDFPLISYMSQAEYEGIAA